jgi:hypothetical protein
VKAPALLAKTKLVMPVRHKHSSLLSSFVNNVCKVLIKSTPSPKLTIKASSAINTKLKVLGSEKHSSIVRRRKKYL